MSGWITSGSIPGRAPIGLLLDVAAPSLSAPDNETQTLSVRIRLRRSGREIRMVIDGTDPFAGLQFQSAAS
jgi:hypothetical protein